MRLIRPTTIAPPSISCVRILSRNASNVALRRSYLYVPASSDRMLQKSLTSNSDVIIYDLEDSVPPSAADKASARTRLKELLRVCAIPLPADLEPDLSSDRGQTFLTPNGLRFG